MKNFWTKTLIVALLATTPAGCSMIAGRTGPPDPHHACNPSRFPVALDFLGTGFFGLATTLGVVLALEGEFMGGPVSTDERIILGTVPTGLMVLTSYSLRKGREYVQLCEQRLERELRKHQLAISEAYWNGVR